MDKPPLQQNSVEFSRCALAALHTLDTAIGLHLEWLRNLHRTLVCSGKVMPEDMSVDAHHHCRFGKWYYGKGMADLGHEPGFRIIEGVHQDMHAAAARLLRRQADGEPVDQVDYDTFMELAVGFKQRVRQFQYEIMNRVCVVDHLTGVWNRYAMNLRLVEEMGRVQRDHQTCALCMLDIDHFKQVNDSHGHRVGDAVLQGVASFLVTRLRSYDTVFRYGGEEFLLCLPNSSLDAAHALINRLREELAMQPLLTEAGPVSVTASFGVSAMDPAYSVDEAIERADRALLFAKAGGRNRVCVWDAGLGGETS